MKLSVITRMLLGFSVLLLLIFLVAGIGQYSVTKMGNEEDQMVHQLLPMTEQTNQLSGLLLNSARLAGLYASSTQASQQKQLKQQQAQLATDYQDVSAALRQSATNYPSMVQSLSQLDPLAKRIFMLSKQSMQLHDQLQTGQKQLSSAHKDFVSDWSFFKDDAQMVDGDAASANKWLTSGLLRDGLALVSAVNQTFYEARPTTLKKQMSIIQTYIKTYNDKYSRLQKDAPDSASDLSDYADLITQLTSKKGFLQQISQVVTLEGQQATQLTELNQTIDESLSELAQMQSQLATITENVSEQSQHNIDRSRWLSGLVIVISIVLSLLVIFSIVQSIRGPLKATLAQIKLLVGGNYSQRLNIKRMDEFGQISGGLNELTEQLNQIISSIIADAGILEQQARQGVDASDHTREVLSTQVKRTEQVSENMKQMAEQVREVSVQAEASTATIHEVSENAHKGRDAIEKTVTTTQTLHQMMTDMVEQMSELQQRSQDIGSIVDVIQGISEQTNLLALNAAIESARAGEHGRGFAVVAEQVRNLATKTQDSTAEILTVIQQLQSQSSESVEMIQNGQNMAVECLDEVHANDQILQTIAQQMVQAQQYSDQILVQAKQALELVNNVTEHSEDIVQLSVQAGSDAEQQQAGSVILKEQSQKQLQRMEQFQLA